jgi:hypothetical protein
MQKVQPSRFFPLKSSMAVDFPGEDVLQPARTKRVIENRVPNVTLMAIFMGEALRQPCGKSSGRCLSFMLFWFASVCFWFVFGLFFYLRGLIWVDQRR